ncbi:MAG: phospholipid-binding protein MlaC [Nitrospinales bacterium]
MNRAKSQSRMGVVLVALCFLLSNVPGVLASEITDNLKTTIDDVIKIVSDEKYKNDKKTRREKLQQVINKRFSYEQMSMRSLAQNWKKLTDEEKNEFVQVFSKLLENTYANKLESYQDQKINYVEEVIKGNYALVKTEIVKSDDNLEVSYKLIKLNGDWKVYDFVVEGVSLIKNYRSQFSKIIRKESYQALIKKMTAKTNELDSSADNSETQVDKL